MLPQILQDGVPHIWIVEISVQQLDGIPANLTCPERILAAQKSGIVL